jgi:hypothetical protein
MVGFTQEDVPVPFMGFNKSNDEYAGLIINGSSYANATAGFSVPVFFGTRSDSVVVSNKIRQVGFANEI